MKLPPLLSETTHILRCQSIQQHGLDGRMRSFTRSWSWWPAQTNRALRWQLMSLAARPCGKLSPCCLAAWMTTCRHSRCVRSRLSRVGSCVGLSGTAGRLPSAHPRRATPSPGAGPTRSPSRSGRDTQLLVVQRSLKWRTLREAAQRPLTTLRTETTSARAKKPGRMEIVSQGRASGGVAANVSAGSCLRRRHSLCFAMVSSQVRWLKQVPTPPPPARPVRARTSARWMPSPRTGGLSVPSVRPERQRQSGRPWPGELDPGRR